LMMSTFVISATLLFVNGYGVLAGIAIALALIPGWIIFRLLRRIDRLDRL
jgi:hypothetical protein